GVAFARWRQFDGAPECIGSRGEVAAHEQHAAEIAEQLGVLRSQLDAASKLRDGRGPAPLLVEEPPVGVVDPPVTAAQADGLLVDTIGGFDVALRLERRAEPES